MDLFAKERKSRKAELTKLRGQLDEKQSLLDMERATFLKEKNELVSKWKRDSKKHQEFYDFMNVKVAETEK